MLKRVYENNKLSTNPAAFRTRRGLEHTTVQSRQARHCLRWVGRHAMSRVDGQACHCPGWAGSIYSQTTAAAGVINNTFDLE